MTCSLCGGPLYVLGWLGKLLWSRCRSCGTTSCSTSYEPAEDE